MHARADMHPPVPVGLDSGWWLCSLKLPIMGSKPPGAVLRVVLVLKWELASYLE